jgi:choline dehydrogenase
MTFPRRVDTLILGGGTTGCAIAGLLAGRSDESILVVEAGPDYGPLGDGRWPEPLRNAAMLGTGVNEWGFRAGKLDPATGEELLFERARVIGGCSSHNGCAAIWGAREDYDGWAAAGCDGWSTTELDPLMRAVDRRLRVQRPALADLTPFQAAARDALIALGIPATDDLNDLDEPQGVAPSPVNIDGGVRFNAAFAYLDPVRHRPNLHVLGDALVDRLVVRAGTVLGAEVLVGGMPVTIEAGRTIVAGGAYGSPAILERSGIGTPARLVARGIRPVHALPGVGENLHDHPAMRVLYEGSPALVERMRERAARGFCPEEQIIAKVRSPLATEAFDLHVYPVGGPERDGGGGYFFELPVACMTPRSRGTCHVRSADPAELPAVDTRFLTDPDGHDRAVLEHGLAFVRELARQEPFASLIGAERWAPTDLARDWVHYYHPVGTCKMGPASDPAAVVDARGRIHGLEGGYVADCSIMPVVPRANTNVPAVLVGERIACWL